MKNTVYCATVLLAAIALAMPSTLLFADEEGGDWKSLKHESKRMKLDETAEAALQALFAENAKAKDLYEGSYGWAVFDNLKLAFGLSGGGTIRIGSHDEEGDAGGQHHDASQQNCPAEFHGPPSPDASSPYPGRARS